MAGVSYRERKAAWFEERLLRRHAGVFHLWALGVGAVISGDFFGWNFGFLAGGFGGLLAALVLMTVLYIGLCFSLAELSAALPHAGGAYSFARASMGPWGGDKGGEPVEAVTSYQKGLQTADKLVSCTPDSATNRGERALLLVRLAAAHGRSGMSQAGLGKLEEAIREFDAALRLEPGNAHLRKMRDRTAEILASAGHASS